MALQIGESIGHYQIVEELGVGGNGRVLKVQHLITRRREAMKILANGRPTSQEYAHRVLREIRLQASLDHPNIAAVLNAFWLEDDLVMIMELIDGVTLQKILERRRLNIDQSINLVRQVLNALTYAHANGVIHRDVSTANIIVCEDGRVKLTDFGLAKGSADLNITESGGMVGSPYYISPEQVRGTAATDQRSDIYSTGVVLYELLTGTRPFEADSTFMLMQAHVQQKAAAPIERNAAIPQFISEAVMKAMAKNPWDRFQTTADFLAALEGPVEKPLPLPEFETPPPPPPVQHSHSFAAPIPHEDAPVAAKAKTPVPAGAMRRILTSPAVAVILGVGIVVAAVAPVMFYDFESGRPRFSDSPKPVPAESNSAIPTKSEAPILTAGPKEIPAEPKGSGSLIQRRAAAARKNQAVSAPAAPAPQIVVWGDAKTAPVVTQASPPVPAPVAVPPPVTKKMEEPPPVLPSSAPKAVIEPTVQQPVGNVPRRGLFRRLATGVRSLNPVRKDSAVAERP
ncbi:MAG: serine/threonine-protein kinase [Acidobacteria bacterium]|nr:serine/threonine-protein kinase [Acidobacteriota bacterium]